jgi:hypothetical protein
MPCLIAVAEVTRRVRLLLIEDSAADAALIVSELKHAGYDPQVRRVETGPVEAREVVAG